jgi:hypothetical protein
MQGYCREFQIEDGNIADMARIRHLADLEVKLMRCDSLTAINPALVMVVWDKEERPRKVLNPILRYDLLLKKERSKVLGILRSAMAGV